MSIIERWSGGLGKPCVLPALSVAGARVSPPAPFPPPAHRTGFADLPHPALRRGSEMRPTAPLSGGTFTVPVVRSAVAESLMGGDRQHGHSPDSRPLPERPRSQAP